MGPPDTKAENRAALAGILAVILVVALDVGLLFATRDLFDAARGSDLAATAIVAGVVAVIVFNFWLFLRLMSWLDRLFGGDGR